MAADAPAFARAPSLPPQGPDVVMLLDSSSDEEVTVGAHAANHVPMQRQPPAPMQQRQLDQPPSQAPAARSAAQTNNCPCCFEPITDREVVQCLECEAKMCR